MLAGLVNWWSQENMRKENEALVERVIELEDDLVKLQAKLEGMLKPQAPPPSSLERVWLYSGKKKGKTSFTPIRFKVLMTQRDLESGQGKENFFEVMTEDGDVLCSSFNLALVWKYVTKVENDVRGNNQ